MLVFIHSFQGCFSGFPLLDTQYAQLVMALQHNAVALRETPRGNRYGPNKRRNFRGGDLHLCTISAAAALS
jgi:hypothetical protein